MRLPLLISSLFALLLPGLLPAAVPSGEVLRIPLGGAERAWQMDHAMLYVRPAVETGAFREIPRQPDTAALTAYAAELEAAEGGVCSAVLRRSDSARPAVLTRRVLVEMADGAQPAALATACGAVSHESPEYSPRHLILTFSGMLDGLSAAETLRTQPGVVSAAPMLAQLRQKRFTPNDPRFAWGAGNTSYQWHLKNTGQNGGTAGIDINSATAWDTVKGSGIRIGIVDDGLEVAHPDLSPAADTVNDHDWNDGTPDDPTGNPSVDDHGTACAGLAAARGNNSIGVSGSAPSATLVGLRLIAGAVDDSDEAAAVSWKKDIIQIYSNSWGPDDDAADLYEAGALFQAAVTSSLSTGRGGRGSIILWAGGNGGELNDRSSYDGYANLPGTIAIAAANDDGGRSSYSEEGANLIVTCPSDDDGHQSLTTVTTLSSYTNDFGGTSGATPIAAGVVALMLERNPNLGWRDVQEILIRTARKVSAADTDWADNGAGYHFNHKFGAGMIDATAAVSMAATWTNLAAQQSTLQSDSESGAVPDNNAAGLTRTLTFPAAGEIRVEHAVLTVQATHARRGDLEVTLTSPSGMVSRLFIAHTADTNSGMSWPFLSVRHWGESSAGAWTVKVADRRSGTTGTLTNVSLSLRGVPLAPPVLPPVITSTLTASGTQSAFFSYQIAASNSPASWGATGLPAGLSVNAAGVISGTPSVSGTFNVGLSATNAAGTGTATLVLTLAPRTLLPPVITSPLTAEALAGAAWSYQISATNSPTSFAAPARPAWMALNSGSGLLFGTPPAAGPVSFTISATNGDGTGTATLNLTVSSTGTALSAAVDAPALGIISSSPAWITVTTGAWDGVDAAASPTGLGNSQSALMSCTVTGPGALICRYKVSSEADYDFLEILVDGTPQWADSGESGWQLISLPVPAGSHTVGWRYKKDSSTAEGSDRAWVDAVEFTSTSTAIGRGVEAENLTWTEGGSGSWQLQGFTTSDGADAVWSPDIPGSASTWIETRLMGPGSLTWKWLVSSEDGYDFLHFDLDGVSQQSISGDSGVWATRTVSIPAGVHTVRWRYAKDSSTTAGSDTGYVDGVAYTPQLATGSPYQKWLAGYFPLSQQGNAWITGPTEDPDKDGRSNFTEYAFGGSPAVADAATMPSVARVGGEVHFTWTVDTTRTDVVLSPQTSDGTGSWLNSFSEIVSTAGNVETRRTRTPVASRRFFRLSAVAP